MSNSSYSRRDLARLTAGGLGLAGLSGSSRSALATPSASDRLFLFVYVNGGWDPTYVLAPMFDAPDVSVDPNSSVATSSGGLSYVTSDYRPSVSTFFSRYAADSCIINGLEVRSITHTRCQRLLMTGGSSESLDDWGAILASRSTDLALPYLVTGGPAFSNAFTDSVVRLGPTGQFIDLLNGDALAASDIRVSPPGADAAALEEAFLRSRVASYKSSAPSGNGGRMGASYEASLERMAMVASIQDELQLDSLPDDGRYVTTYDKALPVLSSLERGFSRAAIVEHNGLWGVGWDTHANNAAQSGHYEDLFADLLAIMDDIQTRAAPGGGSLADVLTVVVISEMGRSPRLNPTEGKDHWTYTSAMLIGGGIRGEQNIGDYTEDLIGEPIDLATGAIGGETHLTAAHLGATLLQLGDIDPEEFLPGVQAITAAIDGG